MDNEKFYNNAGYCDDDDDADDNAYVGGEDSSDDVTEGDDDVGRVNQAEEDEDDEKDAEDDSNDDDYFHHSIRTTVNNLRDLPSDVLQRILGFTLVGKDDRTNVSLVCKWMMHQVDNIHSKLLERFMEKHRHRMDGMFLERIHKISREDGTVSTTQQRGIDLAS